MHRIFDLRSKVRNKRVQEPVSGLCFFLQFASGTEVIHYSQPYIHCSSLLKLRYFATMLLAELTRRFEALVT